MLLKPRLGIRLKSGIWPLYRFDPRRINQGEPPLVVDVRGGKLPVQEYMNNETRFRMVERINPEGFRRFAIEAQRMADRRMAVYEHMSRLTPPGGGHEPEQDVVAEQETAKQGA